MALDGKLIVEWAELESQARSDRRAVKSFLSSQHDTYRRPYAPVGSEQPRGCVIVGSTNEPDCLNDPTGERRFWPVTVGDINVDWLAQNREQLFAEAVVAYRAGERWWFDNREPDDKQLLVDLGEVHSEHSEEDSWTDYVTAWIENGQFPRFRPGDILNKNKTESMPLTTQNIIDHALPPRQQSSDRSAQNRIGAILRRLGYVKFQMGPKRLKAWRKK